MFRGVVLGGCPYPHERLQICVGLAAALVNTHTDGFWSVIYDKHSAS